MRRFPCRIEQCECDCDCDCDCAPCASLGLGAIATLDRDCARRASGQPLMILALWCRGGHDDPGLRWSLRWEVEAIGIHLPLEAAGSERQELLSETQAGGTRDVTFQKLILVSLSKSIFLRAQLLPCSHSTHLPLHLSTTCAANTSDEIERVSVLIKPAHKAPHNPIP